MLAILDHSLKARRRRLWRSSFAGLFFLGVVLGTDCRVVCNQTPKGIPDFPEMERLSGPSEQEIAYRFAPLIHHQVEGEEEEFSTRADFLTSFDFDGDRKTANNRESLLEKDAKKGFRFGLKASVYYALVESKTHWFITYHFYHALDWSHVPDPFHLGIWHENDGESVLVVVEKTGGFLDGRVVMAALQAHNQAELFRPRKEGQSAVALAPQLQLSIEEGRPLIFVESQGHALRATLKNASTLYRPVADAREASLWSQDQDEYRYQLLSVRKEMWIPFVRGQDLGDGRVMDGKFSTTKVSGTAVDIPAFYDSDMLSLWITKKRDSGVLPFRMGFDVTLGESVGELFFDPAKELASFATKDHPWSLEYCWHPYRISN